MSNQLCYMDNCAHRADARGLCKTHYARWRRHGSPHVTKITPPGSALKWLRQQVNHRGHECLIWPFRQGDGEYPYYDSNHRRIYAHREMCRLAHGEPKSACLHAAHSCGNIRCVNPRHLRWATPKENSADMIAHGTVVRGEQSPASKLTAEQVLDARRRVAAGESRASIARSYGVFGSTIDSIISGKTWAWLRGGGAQ